MYFRGAEGLTPIKTHQTGADSYYYWYEELRTHQNMSVQTGTNIAAPGAPQFNAEIFNRDVRDAISEYKKGHPRRFVSSSELSYDGDLSTLLGIIVSTCLGSPGPDRQACAAHLGTHRSLVDRLFDAYRDKSFADLLSDPGMPPQVKEFAEKNISQMRPSVSDPSLKGAFETPYVGKTHEVFIDALAAERALRSDPTSLRAYNFAVSVIQSSGMGKSRMVEEAGNIMFTIPINIREKLPPGIKTYPPSDGVFRQYFEDRKSRTDDEQQADYAVLLRVLFEHATKLIKKRFHGHTGAVLALEFADYLREGRDEGAAGKNRQQFLDDVANEAAKLRAGPEMGKTLESLARSLRAGCRRLVNVIRPEPKPNTNACFVYFDEAHSLTQFAKTPVPTVANELPGKASVSNPSSPDKPPTKAVGSAHPVIQPIDPSGKNQTRTPYHNLGRVLSELVNEPIFFIFLSTNSCLESFAPTAANHPSAREVQGQQLISPFTELPFDVFEEKTMPLTLAALCTTERMVKFGRALWQAQREICPDRNIIGFAVDKLTAAGLPEHEFDSRLAALGVRIGITFRAVNPAGHAAQSRLVETHMRVVYSIPQHRAYMHTGYSSEPILAEAAARYLNGRGKQIAKVGPKNLSQACHQGFLARGERGELFGRLLVTIAHDIAVRDHFGQPGIAQQPPDQPRYHYPIPLLSFLRALFHPAHHGLVLGALPISGSTGAKTLKEAFSDSFVFFSHFAIAGDSDMLSAIGLSAALVRGAAIQARDNQASINGVIPVHIGPVAGPITEKTTSAINLQFKNRKKVSDFWVDRTILDSDKAKPVISIVFEFGSPKSEVMVSRRSHPSTCGSGTKTHWDDHHYQIVAHGHSSTTFGAVAPGTEPQHEIILGAPTYMDDFPRKGDEGSRNALLNLKPEIFGAQERAKFAGLFGESSAEPPPAQAVEAASAMEGVEYDKTTRARRSPNQKGGRGQGKEEATSATAVGEGDE
ncbi:hypothetical protein FRC10_000786 [Ceratobasidium sp. 414]|nr:hypothetical protein FRC10_000786 [Ceratobasidium sp. 414]